MIEIETDHQGLITIIRHEDPLIDPYRVMQAVRDLGPNQRISNIKNDEEFVVIFSEPNPDHKQRIQDRDQAPITRPYAPFDSWNPEE